LAPTGVVATVITLVRTAIICGAIAIFRIVVIVDIHDLYTSVNLKAGDDSAGSVGVGARFVECVSNAIVSARGYVGINARVGL
jgi:hypothetical protein